MKTKPLDFIELIEPSTGRTSSLSTYGQRKEYADNIPPQVSQWVASHKGARTPVFSPGSFNNYATSKSSTCWGSHGGINTGNGFLVAVCQPSPQSKGDTPVMFYDFKAI